MPRGRSVVTVRRRPDDTPESAIALGERRTRSILYNLRLLDFDLERLAISCYLQGVEDAVETFLRRGPAIFDEPIPVTDCQI